MLRRVFSALIALFVCVGAHAETVGLVLSGGGCKGIAHIGFIQALEENEIPIDYVTGTSMGAIVGSLYAMGYSPAEMIGVLTSKDFQEWSSGRISDSNRYLYAMPSQRPDWVSVNLSPNDSSMMAGMLPTRLINPLPMSFAFMQLYPPATGACRGDFNRLMVPYRCVASDIYRHESVVFSHGELAECVRASMSFPLVFQPIEIGDTLLYDGGLYDVYPVNVMERDFNPDRLIGVDVSTPNTPPGLNDLVNQVENMIMTGYMAPFPDDKGVNVVFDLSRFGLLNWDAAAEIYQIGYKRGMALADSLRSRISARRPAAEVARRRAEFRKGWPELRFDSLSVTGTTPGKEAYISKVFSGSASLPPDTIGIDRARRGFYRVACSGRMRNLVPHALYDSVTGLYSLNLKADPENDYHLGIGGYLTSSPGSFIYVGARWNRYSFRRMDLGMEAWMGQSYMAALLTGSWRLPTASPSDVTLRFSAQRERMYETERMFYDFTSPAFISTTTVWGSATYRIAAGFHGETSLAIAGGRVADSYRKWTLHLPDNEKEHFTNDLGEITLSWRRSTLDNEYLPTSGWDFRAEATGIISRTRVTRPDLSAPWNHQGWGDFRLSTRNFFPLSSRFTLGAEGWFHWSTTSLQPTYEASIVRASAFMPVPTSLDLYDPGFRANQWIAAGVVPVVRLTSAIHLQASAYIYAPLRRILPTADGGARYGGWFSSTEFLGDLSAVMTLPFATVRLYGNYRTTPACHWTAGIGIGLPIRAPRLIR
ncbi:MAG: hypothetical protein HDS11_03460 [Bacteroides sp.]|nr:hypothetical protein [Bacteroides sp.]